MTSAVGSGGRVLLAAGTMTYRHGADFAEPLADLDRVPEALGWVVEALRVPRMTSLSDSCCGGRPGR